MYSFLCPSAEWSLPCWTFFAVLPSPRPHAEKKPIWLQLTLACGIATEDEVISSHPRQLGDCVSSRCDSREPWGGYQCVRVSGALLVPLFSFTIFRTAPGGIFRPKKCHFPHPFSDLASKIHTRFQTWPCTWLSIAYASVLNGIKRNKDE